jgi:hypothetical protein
MSAYRQSFWSPTLYDDKIPLLYPFSSPVLADSFSHQDHGGHKDIPKTGYLPGSDSKSGI